MTRSHYAVQGLFQRGEDMSVIRRNTRSFCAGFFYGIRERRHILQGMLKFDEPFVITFAIIGTTKAQP